MKVVDKGTPVITLKSEAGDEINLLIHFYDTYSDEIVLKSNIRETVLKRAWVGDMVCYVPAGMDLDLYDIAKSNINHIDVDVNSKVLTHGYRPDGEKIINITFRNAGQHNEDLTIALHDNEEIERLIILNASDIEVIDGELCIDGYPISELSNKHN